MKQLIPECVELDVDLAYSDLVFPPGMPCRPYTVLNMVTTVDGKATIEGRAGGIGSKTDHILMRKIRAAADAVLVGAGTLRAEVVDPRVPESLVPRRLRLGLAPQPMAIVVTVSCDLPLRQPYFNAPGVRQVVFTCASTPVEQIEGLGGRVTVIRLGQNMVDLREMMQVLVSDLGVRRVVVEGGPMLNGELVGLGLVDELFWTVAPKIEGGAALKTMVEGDVLPADRIVHLEMVSLYSHDSELYLRYRLEHGGK